MYVICHPEVIAEYLRKLPEVPGRYVIIIK